MKTITLNCSGVKGSPIAFGTWQLGGDWGRFDEETAVAAIRRARELGSHNGVDTSLTDSDLDEIATITAEATPGAGPSPVDMP
jgi:hypothetical protein